MSDSTQQHNNETAPVTSDWGSLHVLLANSLVQTLAQRVPSYEDAEDAVQTAFERGVRLGQAGELDIAPETETWLATVAFNQNSDIDRRSRRIPMLSLDDESIQVAPEIEITISRSQELVEDMVVRRQVIQAALFNLIPAFRTVMIDWMYGLSHSEIADKYHIAEGTVKSRLHRARKIIRPYLLTLLGDEE